jgi:hypothetical protein
MRRHQILLVNPIPVQKTEGIMTMEGQYPSVMKGPAKGREADSSLVRRLVQARDDPAKQRIRRWLSHINDERLLAFGLTPEDILILRDSDNPAQAGSRRFAPSSARPPDITDLKARALNRQRLPRHPSHDRRSA